MSSHNLPVDGPSWLSNMLQRLRLGRHLSDSGVAALTYGSDLAGPVSSAIASPAFALARAHTDACESCRQRVQDARAQDEASAMLLSVLDVPAPILDVASVITRARTGRLTSRSEVEHASRPRPIPVRLSRQYAIAASFLFAMIGVTALAFPGSPLRMMLEHVNRMPDLGGAPDTLSVRPRVSKTTSSIAIVPAAHFTIEFRGTGSVPPTLNVRYCDTTLASLRMMQPNVPRPTEASKQTMPSARFKVSADRIVVTQDSGRDSAPLTYELAIPDSNRALSVTANGKVVNVRPLPLQKRPRRSADQCDPPIAIAWTP